MSPFFALFDNLGGAELVMVLVAALLVFGRRLPEVASQAAQQIGKFKRGLDDAWRQSGVEKEIRDIKNVIPRDLSVTGVARQAARRFEERIAEVGDEAKAQLESQTPVAPIEDPAARPAMSHDASLRDPEAPPDASPPGTEPRGAPSVPFRGPDPRAGTVGHAPRDAAATDDASRGVSGTPLSSDEPPGTNERGGGARPPAPPGAPLFDRTRGGASSSGEASSEATT